MRKAALVDESQSLGNREGRACVVGGISCKREPEDLLRTFCLCGYYRRKLASTQKYGCDNLMVVTAVLMQRKIK